MYNKRFAECFPTEDLPPLWYCKNQCCFYYEAVLKMDECVWKDRWNSLQKDLIAAAHCPSCQNECQEFDPEDQGRIV